jgi:hypothetical protein
MQGYANNPVKRNTQGNEGNDLIPQEVLDAIEAVVASGREAIAKKERGKWVVLENNRRLVYKEP